MVLVASPDDPLIDPMYPSVPFPKSLARVRARHASPSGPTAQEPEAAEEPSQTPMAAAARGSAGEESWAAVKAAAEPASEARRARRELPLSFFALVPAVTATATRGAAAAPAVDAAGDAAATAVDPLWML